MSSVNGKQPLTTSDYFEFIPVLSTVKSFVDIFIKWVCIPCMSRNTLKKHSYCQHLKQKESWKTIAALVPVLGNIILVSAHHASRKKPSPPLLSSSSPPALTTIRSPPMSSPAITASPLISSLVTAAASSSLPVSTLGVRSDDGVHRTEQIDKWLFGGAKDPLYPTSVLAIKQSGRRLKENFAPKASFSSVRMLDPYGMYMSRIGIYSGGVTDLRAEKGERAAVGDSNNGDLLTGCGFAVATAIINATGPNLQRDLYNDYGVIGVMGVPKEALEKYGDTEGRGYSLTYDAYDMRESHNIERVEFMTVPMHSEMGVRNMYAEAFKHSQDLDFIALPMAGMSHPVLEGRPELSAKIAMEEFQKFVDTHPGSKLKVVFTIFNNDDFVELYASAAWRLQ